jgi:hypothetical protein
MTSISQVPADVNFLERAGQGKFPLFPGCPPALRTNYQFEKKIPGVTGLLSSREIFAASPRTELFPQIN